MRFEKVVVPSLFDALHACTDIDVAAAWGQAKGLSQRKDCGAYNLTVDENVHFICTGSQRARTQIVNVLTAINPEV